LYYSRDFFSVSYALKWICLILTMILPYFSDSNVVSSFSSPCYPFTTSRGFGGKDPKQG